MVGQQHPLGHYSYAPGIEPYSGGAVAAAGNEVRHYSLIQRTSWRDGFGRIEDTVDQLGLDRSALCGVELRCPQPHTFAGFVEFNREYRALLDEWGLLVGDDNPIARTNVAPVFDPPDATELTGFCLVVPVQDDGRKTFVIAGAGDLVDQADLRPEAIVGAGRIGADLWRARVEQVLDEMEHRMSTLGVRWEDATDIDVYCASAGWAALAHTTIAARCGAGATRGLQWVLSHPPIVGLSFEMDVRGIRCGSRI